MIARRTFLRSLGGSFVTMMLCGAAQPPKVLRTIGWLHLGHAWPLQPFREKLRALGWIEGVNIVIAPRWADNVESRLPTLAAELVELGVDVIVTQTTPAAKAAHGVTKVVPIVMAGSSDPVKLGIVRSLANPGENVTGLTNNPGAGFSVKMLQLLKQAAPGVSRLAILGRAGEVDGPELDAAPSGAGFVAVMAEANTQDDVAAALDRALAARAEGLLALPNSVNDPERKAIVNFTLRHGWPSMGGDKYFVAAGGLMSYWADWTDIRRQAAVYVDRILRGAHPGDLPVQQPSKFELAINLRTAKALRLSIPPSLVLRADEMFQ